MIDPRCEICADAYGTRYVCAPCRADKANDGWVVSREDSRSEPSADINPTPWNEGEVQELSVMFRRITKLLLTKLSMAEIARRTGCSVAYVRKVRKELPQ